MMHLTFKTRLALGHLVYVALILGLAAFVLSWAMARLVRSQVDAEMLGLARLEVAAIEATPREPPRIHEAPPGAARPVFVRLDKFLQIVTLGGEPVAWSTTLGTARLPLSPATRERLARGAFVFETVEDFGEEPIRMVSVPVALGSARYVVQVAASLEDARAVVRAAHWLFLIVAVMILLAVVATGTLLARRALVPIDHIVAQARQIGDSNLAGRLPHPGTRDEIGRLVETLNDMLNRIERSFEMQQRFTADASHELMSPLSRLRAELEITLRRPRASAEYEETLRSCLEEVERLSTLTEELLGLVRIDTGEGRGPVPGPASVQPILRTVMQRLEGEAQRRHVTMEIESPSAVSVKASPAVVSVALANVLENAVKFCRPGGRVTVRVDAERDEVVVAVSDTGPGVFPDEIPLIFERFHRGRASHSTGAPGVGLGLAICRTLVEREGGRVSVTSTPGEGATFAVRLPLAL
jgi:two-component system OmpR family sensor kinase